jgi:ABC-type Na+ efflux pump permease subunit
MIAAALRPASLQIHARPARLFSVTEEQLQPLLVKTKRAKKGKNTKAKKKYKQRKKKSQKRKKEKNNTLDNGQCESASLTVPIVYGFVFFFLLFLLFFVFSFRQQLLPPSWAPGARERGRCV